MGVSVSCLSKTAQHALAELAGGASALQVTSTSQSVMMASIADLTIKTYTAQRARVRALSLSVSPQPTCMNGSQHIRTSGLAGSTTSAPPLQLRTDGIQQISRLPLGACSSVSQLSLIR